MVQLMNNRNIMCSKGDEKMKEDIQFLKEFQQELLTQDNDGQATPRFWAIMDYKWEVTTEGHHERISLYNPNTGEYATVDEYIDEILNGYRKDKFTKEQIEKLNEINKYFLIPSELEQWIKENDDDEYYFIYEEEVFFIAYNTCFFTKEEAKKHLEDNRHHYSDKAHPFAMTAWGAPKLERLMKILETFDWNKIEEYQKKAEKFIDLKNEIQVILDSPLTDFDELHKAIQDRLNQY